MLKVLTVSILGSASEGAQQTLQEVYHKVQ